MDKAFRAGKGAYVQQQGPFPQQLEADGAGRIVAQVGPLIGPCAFSSLAARREWLETDAATAFMRAYRKARIYMTDTPAAEIARLLKPVFPAIDEPVLARCIETYQQLGCWPQRPEITRDAFEVTIDVFQHAGTISERYPYDQICAAPPDHG